MTPGIVVALTIVWLLPAGFGVLLVRRHSRWPRSANHSPEIRTILFAIGWFLLTGGALFVLAGVITLIIRT